jgi:hypothetical protein
MSIENPLESALIKFNIKETDSTKNIDLSYVKIDEDELKALLRFLAHEDFRKEININLCRTEISNEDIEAIAEALISRQSPIKFQINFGSNNIGIKGCEAIAKILKSVKYLDGSGISLADCSISGQGLEIITKAVSSQKFMSRFNIDLSENYFGDEGAKMIAEIFKSENYTSKIKINFSYNSINDKGAKMIANALISKNGKTGVNINLGTNPIGIEGWTAIAKALISHVWKEKVEIGFSSNTIGNESAQIIASVLTSKTKKFEAGVYIDIRYNSIDDTGAKAIADLLGSPDCPQAVEINLTGNPIGIEGIEALVNAMKKNTTCIIDISGEPGCDFLNERNRLIAEYPHHKPFILSACAKDGLYTPTVDTSQIISLKHMTGCFIHNSQNREALKTKLPKDIQNFLKQIKHINKVLDKIKIEGEKPQRATGYY